jgi:hypothetical protein
MKIEFENLGPLEKGELDLSNLKNLNVIIGPNNSGKTYFSYFIYTVLKKFYEKIDLNFGLKSKGIRNLLKKEEKDYLKELLKDLPIIFHTNEKKFKNTKINVSLHITDKFDNIEENYHFENTSKILDINNIYFFPAERSGAVLFYKQLFQSGNDILRKFELSRDVNILKDVSNYPEPINEYMKFLNRNFEDRNETEIYKNVFVNIEDIIDGEILVRDDKILYKNKKDFELEMGLVSSTVKTLVGFYLYIKYCAKEGDIIFIDEIELNLHPRNQLALIKLFNILTKYGIKFIVSTHSPLIMQEINNMILYEEKKKNSNIEKVNIEYNVNQNYGIDKDDINVWFLNDGTVNELKVDEEGVETSTFNKVVAKMNNFYQDLYFLDED